MIGFLKNGRYSHEWLWIRMSNQRLRPQRDSRQLRYCNRYTQWAGFKNYILTMCTYPKLK